MKKTAIFLYVIVVGALLFLGSGCSDSKFSASNGNVQQQCFGNRPGVSCQPCAETENCSNKFVFTDKVESQETDILFVVDNSGSMYEDQVEMGSKFPSFLNSISQLDYRIGITTTDISFSMADNGPAPHNGQGDFQDGKLIAFNNGAPFLDGSLPISTEENYFLNAITRDETRNCENNLSTCPSGDERGILAAALTIQNNPAGFIRPNGQLAIVFLSDEDEGSDGDLIDSRENPNNFANNFRTRFPNKSLTTHSIIIQPGDNNCFEQQKDLLWGRFGNTYAQLTDLTGGVQGSICSNSYSSQLRDIGTTVANRPGLLPCASSDVRVSFNPQPPYQVDWRLNSLKNQVEFSRSLPSGTEVRYEGSCGNNTF